MDTLSPNEIPDAPVNNEETNSIETGRRAFLRTALLGTAAVGMPLINVTRSQVRAQAASKTNSKNTPAAPIAPSGLIIRQREPENVEFPFSSLNSFITPNERFFIENQFATPRIEANNWRLQIEGAVDRPFEITYDELLRMPSQTVTATLESAGNNRVFLNPPERGVQWELGAVGTAQWTGVPLSEILERAGVREEAIEVILEGADSGEVREEPRPPGSIRFARSLPLDKARQPEVLLAYKMNGVDLPGAHGFPVRAVVPGWYGMAWVRWLSRILVSSVPFRGYFQSVDYNIWERRNGVALLSPVTEMQVKAQIARPTLYETVPLDKPYRVFGAAWAGESDVSQVEISSDDGRTWEKAALLGTPTRFAWRLWEYRWQTPKKAGRYNLMARATDSGKRVQPMQRDSDRRSYMINHLLSIPVEVR